MPCACATERSVRSLVARVQARYMRIVLLWHLLRSMAGTACSVWVHLGGMVVVVDCSAELACTVGSWLLRRVHHLLLRRMARHHSRTSPWHFYRILRTSGHLVSVLLLVHHLLLAVSVAGVCAAVVAPLASPSLFVGAVCSTAPSTLQHVRNPDIGLEHSLGRLVHIPIALASMCPMAFVVHSCA